MIWGRKHAGMKLHITFCDPSIEWIPLLDRYTTFAMEFPSLETARGIIVKTAPEEEQVKRGDGMLAPVFILKLGCEKIALITYCDAVCRRIWGFCAFLNFGGGIIDCM